MSDRKEIHDRVLNATNKDELADAYKEWAEAYDTDLVNEMGYVAHTITTEILLKKLNSNQAQILDAGCGTGLVGVELHKRGFQNIDGLDYSQDMLNQARAKEVYQSLTQGDLTSRLKIADNTYDAVISVGTFTCGHVGPDALEELVRITKPDGYICFTVREQAWEEDDYRKQMDDMSRQGLWQQQEELTTDYIQQEGSNCKVCLYRVSK